MDLTQWIKEAKMQRVRDAAAMAALDQAIAAVQEKNHDPSHDSDSTKALAEVRPPDASVAGRNLP